MNYPAISPIKAEDLKEKNENKKQDDGEANSDASLTEE